jgi:hypothetical protein
MLKGPTAQRAIPKVYHGRMKNPPVGRGAEPFGGRKHFVVQPFPCRQLPNAACLHCQNRLARDTGKKDITEGHGERKDKQISSDAVDELSFATLVAFCSFSFCIWEARESREAV